MNDSTRQDQNLDANLRTVLSKTPFESVPDHVRQACLDPLDDVAALRLIAPHSTRRLTWRRVGRWALAAAAGLALLATLIGLPGRRNTVRAAAILQQFRADLAANSLLDLVVSDWPVDDTFLDAELTAATGALVGDIQIGVDDDDATLRLDATLAFSSDGGWVLVRELAIPDPSVGPLLAGFFPPGSETLVILPNEDEFFHLDLNNIFGNASLFDALIQAVESGEVEDATLVEQADGTYLLSVPLRDDVLTEFDILVDDDDAPDPAPVAEPAQTEISWSFTWGTDGAPPPAPTGDESDSTVAINLEVDSSTAMRPVTAGKTDRNDDERTARHDQELAESAGTLLLTYDPQLAQVTMFAVQPSDGGEIIGRLVEGELTADQFDSAEVTGPDTRLLNLEALVNLFGGGPMGE